MRRSLFIIIVFIGVQNYLQAQHLLGMSSGNYAGTNTLYLNPAHVSDSRNKLFINLISNDFFVVNNYLAYNAPYSFLGLATNTVSKKYRNDRNFIIWKDIYYHERLNGKAKRLHAANDLRGPSAMYSFKNNKMAVALTSRVRLNMSFTNVSEETARLIRYGTDPIEFQKYYLNQTATFNTDGVVEVGGTFGMVLIDSDEDFLKIGTSIKREVSFFNLHANIENADYRVQTEPGVPNRELLVTQQLKATYGYTTDDAFQGVSAFPTFLMGKNSGGAGWGFDFGAVYEYRPDFHKYKVTSKTGAGRVADPNRNKYLFKISAAITDIGAMRFRNKLYERHFDVDRTVETFSYQRYQNFNDVGDATRATYNTLGQTPLDNYANPFNVGLPTAFNLSLDYAIREKIYLNALWVQGLRSATSMSMKPQSVLAVTPRYETRWLEVAMPVALIDNYSTLSVGLAARAGVVFLGTDHLGGMLNIGKPRGLDFYFGVNIPLAHSKAQNAIKCWYPPYEKTPRRKK
jgi:Family of unknown function (DUF5723)